MVTAVVPATGGRRDQDSQLSPPASHLHGGDG